MRMTSAQDFGGDFFVAKNEIREKFSEENTKNI